ncbi:MAG: FkbM family methyltransferase [Pseudomonadota bacterium]
MIRSLYKALLRMPRFRGRHRLEAVFRRWLLPAVDTVDGIQMELDPQEWLQIHLMAGELPEPATTALLRSLLRPGDVCIDVGAHVGFLTLAAAQRVGPTGQVVAIEPQPYNCDRILMNSQANGLENIVVVMAAAGDRDGFARLHNQKRNDKARLTLAGGGVSDVSTRFEVPLARVDSVAARWGLDRVRLIKIDVEGFEREVFAGARETLARADHVIFECLPDMDPAVVRVLVETLRAEGFTLRGVDGAAWAPGAALVEHNVWASRAPG